MHFLLLVTLAMPEGSTSKDARVKAHSHLGDDNSFCGDGRFASPLCDWYVIGGGWSGRLREALLGQHYQDGLQHELSEIRDPCFPLNPGDAAKTGLDNLWRRFGGSGDHPLARNRRTDLGYEDDAMLLDRALYDHFLKDHAGLATNLVGCGATSDYADLDDEPLDESFIGRKWLVAIDYHY